MKSFDNSQHQKVKLNRLNLTSTSTKIDFCLDFAAKIKDIIVQLSM